VVSGETGRRVYLTGGAERPKFLSITGEPTGCRRVPMAKAESATRERDRPMNLIQIMLA
jgi:hypothetical protein